MLTKSKRPISTYYEEHHIDGKRLRQAYMEDIRKQLFTQWIGTEKSILDLGGRDGTLTRHYMLGNKVTLADIDCAALLSARENYALDTVEVNLNEPLPFACESYDVVVLAEVLEHLPYPKLMLREVQRVLSHGGIFIGSIPLAYHLKDRWQVLCGKKLKMADDPTHLQFFKYHEFVTLLASGFQVEDIYILKGGMKADFFPQYFARNIAFRCSKK